MIKPDDILNARILIVDDLEANVLLLEQMLLGAGYTSVSSTMEPDRVCELHLLNRYDLILLDLLMPKMDGFAVMENLKTIETSGYLPVLVITAQPEHKLRALKAGARDFVSKPFDLAEVLLRVHNMLEVRLLHFETLELYDRVVAEKKVSEHLLHELIKHGMEPGPAVAPGPFPAPLGGSRAEVAVIFMDLAAFTAFSEDADAEVLKDLLDAISLRANDPASGQDRTRILRQTYLGTSGLPDTLANHTIATAEKALDLLEAVDRFNSHNPFKIKIRLLVDEGPVPASLKGSHEL